MIRVAYAHRIDYTFDKATKKIRKLEPEELEEDSLGECCGGPWDRRGPDPCGNRVRHCVYLIVGVPYPRKDKLWSEYSEGGNARSFLIAVCTPCLHELGLTAGSSEVVDLEPGDISHPGRFVTYQHT